MKPVILAALAAFLASGAQAQTAVVGDAWIIGPVMVGTTTASSSRLSVVASSATETPFQVSGVDLTPFLRVGKDGKVGMSTYSAANLDVNGSGDSTNTALMLQSGNLYGGGTTRVQLAFGQDGTTNRRHAITSVHSDSTTHNSLDFLIWSPDAGTTSLATMTVLSLVTISSTAAIEASVHVRPIGDPKHELMVSDGASPGGGTIHVAAQVTPSSREWKRDIAYLGAEDEAAAYAHERNLKHVSFRYARLKGKEFVRNSRAPIRRGLIYEDAPAEIRGPGETLSMDQRLLETELAFKE
ncbi:MAG: hypothetical protein ABL955_15550, partial [Elusimicrobiota bacterium]